MSVQPPASIGQWVIYLVAVLAILAIGWIVVSALAIPVPGWFTSILAIVVLAVLAIWGIRTVSGA